MKYKKIIFIGFQKTGTSMFRDIFRKNGFTAAHGRRARLCGKNLEEILSTVDNHVICSDWCEDHLSIDILRTIKDKYPDSLFVLNTRPMWDWIESRFKHYDWWFNIKQRNSKLLENSYFDPTEISEKNAEIFIQQRNDFYNYCVEVFKDNKNFLVLDITQSNSIQNLSNEIGFNLQYEDRSYNKRSLSKITKEGKDKISYVKQKVFNKYGENLMSSRLTFYDGVNKSLLNFKNNIKNKYCFIVVIEDTEIFWRQLELLLFSFRKNTKKHKNSKFWVLINDGNVSEDKIKKIKNKFNPIEIVQKKCELDFSFKDENYKTYRKYNAYKYFNQQDNFERIIHIDADFIFTGDFIEEIEGDKSPFSAHCSGHDVVPENHFEFVKNFLKYTDKEMNEVQVKWVKEIKKNNPKLKIPNFNSGFLNMNEYAFMCIKNNIENYLSKIYSMHEINFKNQVQKIGHYEQIALSLIVINEIKKYSISRISFYGPKCYHMLKFFYGNEHYGGKNTKKRRNIPKEALHIIDQFKIPILKSNPIYRLGDILYRRYSWKKEREILLLKKEYKNTFMYQYLSKIKTPLETNPEKLRNKDKCYGLDEITVFSKSLYWLKEKFEAIKKVKTDTLYINIRAGDIISLDKDELYINNKKDLYQKIKQYLKNYKEINSVKIITTLHFGDNKNNNPRYQYKFSNQDRDKNFKELHEIKKYIKDNIFDNVDFIDRDIYLTNEETIDLDLYILSNAKHVILEKYGGFTKCIEDARDILIKKNPIILKPKIYGKETIENFSGNILNIKRESRHGFFSSCSLCLFEIIKFIKERKICPKLNVEAFPLYKQGIKDNVYDLFFETKNTEIEINDFEFKLRSHNIFYKENDSLNLRVLIDKWFTPKKEIQLIKNNFIIDLNLKTNQTLAVYYRGLDTQKDRNKNITNYDIFVNKVIEKLKDKNIKYILLQTDDKMFEDYIMSSRIEMPIKKIKEIPSVYSNVGFHYLENEKIDHAKKMLASVILMSECKNVICNSSNVSRWIWLYRKKNSGFNQFVKNVFL